MHNKKLSSYKLIKLTSIFHLIIGIFFIWDAIWALSLICGDCIPSFPGIYRKCNWLWIFDLCDAWVGAIVWPSFDGIDAGSRGNRNEADCRTRRPGVGVDCTFGCKLGRILGTHISSSKPGRDRFDEFLASILPTF